MSNESNFAPEKSGAKFFHRKDLYLALVLVAFGAFVYYEAGDGIMEYFTSGQFLTTTAIDEISFKMASGNIDSGTFKMYGVT